MVSNRGWCERRGRLLNKILNHQTVNMSIRLQSYSLSTDPVKRMKVRTHGKRTSKVKTEHAVLRKAEPDYINGRPTTPISNRNKFNNFDKVMDEHASLVGAEWQADWVGTTKVLPMRGASVKYAQETTLPFSVLLNVSEFLTEVLKFKRITHERVLRDYMAFEDKRTKNIERIQALLRSHRNSDHRKDLIRKLYKKWKTCNAHCRYVVSTEVYYDFADNNMAHDIEHRAIKLGSIVVDKAFADGGMFFNRKQCATIKAWIGVNMHQEIN